MALGERRGKGEGVSVSRGAYKELAGKYAPFLLAHVVWMGSVFGLEIDRPCLVSSLLGRDGRKLARVDVG